MDVFDLRRRLVRDYESYTRSFIKIQDQLINGFVDEKLREGAFWPEPLLQLNPTFRSGGTIDGLVQQHVLHPECSKIFRFGKTESDHYGNELLLHEHQRAAIEKSREGQSYVLTSGTGSGKSLTYIVPIVDHVLRRGTGRGIQAIVVYPMNALANSQEEELRKFLEPGYPEGESPVRFARYTGQEKGEVREAIRANPPDVLLTNYMMLELLLTRTEDRELVRASQGLRFLVFDELHTYRGRQGADIALLIRRCRQAFNASDMISIGTSATMASGGSTADQQAEVARVAQSLFGTSFEPDQVIGETLERATPEIDTKESATVAALARSVAAREDPPADFEAFSSHPLASWIETIFGVQSETESGRLVRQTPRRLQGAAIEGQESAAAELASITDQPEEQCAEVLKKFLLAGSNMKRGKSSRFPIFAFRLHQFFTRGDTIWATVEDEATRHLEIEKKTAKPGEPHKPLFPLVFCRHCGAAYYRVREASERGGWLYAREDRRDQDDDGSGDAYLYTSSADPWPDAGTQEALNRLPDFMKEVTSKGVERVESRSKKDVPETIYVAATGEVVSEGEGLRAALIRKNFLFCLNSKCGVTYTRSQRSERSKLATLGVDNRSTATTILAVRSLIELQQDRELPEEARKLLSFTDNRQDASLQAGHFNDFVQVALLRSALHRAMEQRGERGLEHGDLTRAVFDAMQLSFDEYAADPFVRGPAKNNTDVALRQVIGYFLYRDLQRGWRVTAPNLEDCGLLRFEYEGLRGEEGLLAETELWEKGFERQAEKRKQVFETVPPALRDTPSKTREEFLRTLLDVMRKALALKVDVLDSRKQLDLVEQTRPRLDEDTVWYLGDTRELTRAEVAYPRARGKKERSGFFVSSYGAYGRYVKRTLESLGIEHPLKREDVDGIIRFMFLALQRYGIVEQVRSGKEGDDPGYQLNVGSLRWLPGDAEVKPIDRTRLIEAGEMPPVVNQYFVECYRNFVDLNCLFEAREHTAQVTSEERQEREDRFRSGQLPLLFCSPTMELGVDIARLNLVNLRNVPPTPANYAQRSGRAGRGGQPALVFTYCAGRSPHDQYFYRSPSRMVAGAVAPPRLDLANRDLIRSHVYAIWMEVARVDLGKTLAKVLDVTPVDGSLPLPIKSDLLDELRNPAHRAQARAKAEALVSTLSDELAATPWFTDSWVKEQLDQVERSFDAACDRWRSLYRSATRQRSLHHEIIGDVSRPEAERRHSERLRAQAEAQQRLLTEAEGVYEGDFYSYRYFATEGFLPGYNFPRLPLSAFVPGRHRMKGRDEYVSRPRFLAISEFGPRALIYHEGARYRVYKVNLDFGSDSVEATHELSTATMKRCEKCGYSHLEYGKNMAEVCDRCGNALDGHSRIDNLVQLQNVSVKLAQRITCDEEERQRFGYRLATSYRFPEVGGKLDRRDAAVYIGDVLAMRISYADAAELYRINLGWASQLATQAPGFNLDLERGYWARNQADIEDRDDASNEGRIQRVVPYVRDTKNALVMRFEPPRSGPEMAALQAAFKQAIQQHYQLEPRELSVEPMPAQDDRQEILFYESSEGGAGVLRQLTEDPKAIAVLARRALEICHFDPETLEDLRADTCGRACYECLLDYANQTDHKDLDRGAIKDLLSALTQSESRPSGGTGSREDRLNTLRRRCESNLELRWLQTLEDLGLKLPSDAQYPVPDLYVKPDFFYADVHAAIFVDGPVHDKPDTMKDDTEKRRRLLERGYIVIAFHHDDDWANVFRHHQDIFGEIHT